jgi:hypothetical protein
MSKKVDRIDMLTICLLCLVFLSGCSAGDRIAVREKEDVEIAPGKWLTLEREYQYDKAELEAMRNPANDPHHLTLLGLVKQFVGSSGEGKGREKLEDSFTFQWKDKKVGWKGKEIIITLRECDDTLYMAGYNREVSQKSRLIFFKINEKGSGFAPIKAAAFPKQIATQNVAIDFGYGSRHVRVGEDLIDTWTVIRSLDITNRYFKLSFTAAMWYHLETGTEYYNQSRSDLTQQFLKDYVTKYKPIALPTIIKESSPESSTNAAPRSGRTRGRSSTFYI